MGFRKWIMLFLAIGICASLRTTYGSHDGSSTITYGLLDGCNEKLSKYCKFAADFCEEFDITLNNNNEYKTQAEQQAELANFLRSILHRLSDSEIVNTLQDVILQNCRSKLQSTLAQQNLQQQHEIKREYVVLGKKQKFHSWGGKRNPHNVAENAYFI